MAKIDHGEPSNFLYWEEINSEIEKLEKGKKHPLCLSFILFPLACECISSLFFLEYMVFFLRPNHVFILIIIYLLDGNGFLSFIDTYWYKLGYRVPFNPGKRRGNWEEDWEKPKMECNSYKD